jgi:uncharacterized membrane protein YhaH (DUF805 family)
MKLKTFENMFSTEGHKGRLSFLIIQVCMIVVTIANVSFFSVLAEINAWFMLIAGAIFIVQLWAAIVSYIHRIHDIGIGTGWLVLIALPYINTLFLLYLLFRAGDTGTTDGLRSTMEHDSRSNNNAQLPPLKKQPPLLKK